MWALYSCPRSQKGRVRLQQWPKSRGCRYFTVRRPDAIVLDAPAFERLVRCSLTVLMLCEGVLSLAVAWRHRRRSMIERLGLLDIDLRALEEETARITIWRRRERMALRRRGRSSTDGDGRALHRRLDLGRGRGRLRAAHPPPPIACARLSGERPSRVRRLARNANVSHRWPDLQSGHRRVVLDCARPPFRHRLLRTPFSQAAPRAARRARSQMS
jgi:hypothetical protein